MEQYKLPVGVISLFFLPWNLQAQPGCEVTVQTGPAMTLCEGNETITLSAQINGNYLDTRWQPAAGLSDPELASTQAAVTSTTTYTIRVRSRSTVNLITNGDFSQGDVGFTSNYVYGTGGPLGLLSSEGQYAIDDDPEDTHRRFASCQDHTTGTGNMMIVNASGKKDNFWCQSVAVNAGTSYDFSAWVTSVNDENPAKLQFSINGELLGSQFNASSALCQWEEFSAQWTAPLSGSVEICVVNVNLTPAGNDFAIDDIAFNEICEATDSVTITVADLNAEWEAPASICQDDEIIVLNDLLLDGATPGGIWTLDGAQTSALDPSKLAAGTYLLRYAVSQDQCQQTHEQPIEVLEKPYAGAPGPTLRFCQAQGGTLVLAGELQDEDPGGSWTETSQIQSPAGAFDPVTTGLNLAALPAGNYSFSYIVGTDSPCGPSENEIRVIIDPLPAADLGPDRSFTCDDPSLTLGDAPAPGYRYQWSDGNGNALGTQSRLTIETPGTYTLEITDTSSECQNRDEVTISENTTVITASVSASDARCYDSQDGSIRIENPAGGIEPYLFSLGDRPFSNIAQFTGLAPGNYRATVMDAAGCSQEFEVTVNAPGELQVMIQTDDAVLQLGDSIQLEAVVNRPVSQIVWTPDPADCRNCERITVAPAQSTTFFVRVADANGCTAEAQLAIVVKREVDVYIPNAFSPNEDGINDSFYINAAEGIHIVNLQILDRWGNTVFQRNDFAPNDPGMAWDGRVRGLLVPMGVMVYALELKLPNGDQVLLSGELAVIY